MSVDNRTELNDCNSATGWTSDGPTPTANTLAGQRYEGSAAIGGQHSDSDEHTSTTQESVGSTTFSVDMSDMTVYMLVKDNLTQVESSGGIQFVLGDGTDTIGYDVGGNDNPGMDLPPYYRSVKVDVSEKVTTPGNFTAYAGSEANLNHAAITEVGYGSLHAAKAQGNVQNIFLDWFAYIANGVAALTINGGTSGTPETMSDVQGDDASNGWGLIGNPIGSQYTFNCPTEWGNSTSTADSYFQADDEQWYWLGTGIGVGHFDFALVGHADDTNSFVLNNVIIVNTGARAAFDMTDTDVDNIELTSVTFTDLGVITLQVQDAGNKFLERCIFNNCDMLDPSTMDMDNIVFNGANDANGAIWIDEAGATNFSGMTFNSDGTGHAIHLRPTGAGPFSITFDGHTYSGYANDAGTATDRALYYDPVTSSAITTITVIGNGETPSVRTAGGATTPTFVNNKTITFTGMKDNTEVRIYDAGDDSEIDGIENATAGTTDNRSFAWSDAQGNIVNYVIHSVLYETIRVNGYTIPVSDTAIPIQQRIDRNNSNPA